MDAIKCVKEWTRMCRKYDVCEDCPLMSENGIDMTCSDLQKRDPEKFVSIVDKWSAEHPGKKWQDKLLELFPNAKIEDGVVAICPLDVEKDFKCQTGEKCCRECRREYWLCEVEDDE